MPYHYEKLLTEEGKSVSDLPDAIKKKIQGFKLAAGKAAKKPEDKNAQESIERSDLAIADSIQTWLEEELPPPPPAETPEAKEAREAAEKKAADEKAAEEAELASKNAQTEMQNKIVTIMNASSTRSIEKSELEAIIGRTAEKNETIGDLKLYLVYLTTKYKAK